MTGSSRFSQICAVLNARHIDGLLLSATANVSYAAGFHAPDSYALITKHDISIITDFRYTADFQRQAKAPVRVIEQKKSVFHTIERTILASRIKSLGFESRHLTFAECDILNDALAKKVKFIPLKETIEPVREIKDVRELRSINKAVEITLQAFELVKNRLRPGLTELEIAAEIERFIRIKGARAGAFDCIVASGPNSSYPHAIVSPRRLREGEPVVVDMGVDYEGYKSDLTRTFFLGKMPPIVLRAAGVVREAQKKAIQAIRPGALIKDIDAVARHFIAAKGFGKNFGHALGHGVGLEVHESPGINKKNNQILKENMVFTVEPGIYLAGRFGIRMEEMVRVTKDGVEVISGDRRK